MNRCSYCGEKTLNTGNCDACIEANMPTLKPKGQPKFLPKGKFTMWKYYKAS